MPLHRDIFWIGRQWAVTGFGMQAINQKHGGAFDIPVERLWDDDLPEAVCGQKWFNPDDFNKGLALARARFPQSLATPKPVKPLPAASAATAPPPLAAPRIVPAAEAPAIAPVQAAPAPAASVRPPEPPKSLPPKPLPPPPLRMSLLGHPAKLLRVWRAQRRR